MIIHRLALLIVVSNYLYHKSESENMFKSISVTAFMPSTGSSPSSSKAMTKSKSTSDADIYFSKKRDNQLRQRRMLMNSHSNRKGNDSNSNNDLTSTSTTFNRHSSSGMSTSSSTTSLTSTTNSDVSSSVTSVPVMDSSSIIGDVSNNMQSFLPDVDQDILSLTLNDICVGIKEQQGHSLKSLASTLEVEGSYMHSPARPIVCGHRGALYQSLENTRHCFQTASQIGCDEVELDVFLLKCGTLCVFHGDGTDKNPGLLDDYSTNMEGSVLDYTYEELRTTLQFNRFHSEFGCGPSIISDLQRRGECYIPTLEEVLLDAKKNNLVVKIELKGPNTAAPTLELVERLDMVNLCHYSSFNLSQIALVRELRPQRCPLTGEHVYKTGALFTDVPDNYIDLALEVGASEVHLEYSRCTKSRVEEIHDAGMDSMCWFRGPIGMADDVKTKFYDVGNEDEAMLRIVMATGVRKMCLNKPDVLIRMLNRISTDTRTRAISGADDRLQ